MSNRCLHGALRSARTSRRLIQGCLGIVLFAACIASASPHILRVDNRAAARALVEQGARVLEDYGSFQILESGQAPAREAVTGQVQSADRFDFIRLKAGSLNTRAPAILALRKAAGNFSGRRLHLIQFDGPVKPEWRRAVVETGVRMVSYLPENAYLVYGDATALARLQSWAAQESSVQWEGPYIGAYKVSPGARRAEAAAGQPGGTNLFAIQMIADDRTNAATLALIDQWKLGPLRNDFIIGKYHDVIAAVAPGRLADLAARPDVISIQPYAEPRKNDECQDQILAGNLAGNVPAGPGYLAWLKGKGFTQAQFDASGFVVDLTDSGIDNGTTQPGHFGLYELGDPGRGSRVAYCRLIGSPNAGSTLEGCDGHGTLNAHIISGYDDFEGFPFADGSGYRYGLGVCPFVKIGSSVVFDPEKWTQPDPVILETQAYNSGARIDNNSWGTSGPGVYDVDAQAYDTLVRDVGGTGDGREMIIVFVAGNDGPTPGTINSPGTAKNVITVGAAENVRSLDIANGGNDSSGSDGCGLTDTYANSANDVAYFSSRGPCADGRMKPDLVAPGTHVTGGVPEASAGTNGTGVALACFSASSLTALPGGGSCWPPYTPGNPNDFFPVSQEFYTVSSGTSHAAPAVSGACALLRQYFINHSYAPPSPAMTKAFLINSARYMTGSGANDDLWSPSQGMGELDLGMAFDGVSRILRDQLPTDKFSAAGQTRTFTTSVSDPAKPIRVTLAWSDAPGSPAAAQALVNDLDLTVTLGGVEYRGNVFHGAHSIAGGTADSVNNVESVFLPPPGVSNSYTVTVTAANIAADAVNGGSSAPQQDFALVIYNAQASFSPASGTYAGLFYEPDSVRLGTSGAFKAAATARGTYTGTLQTAARRYRFSGRFDSTGAGTSQATAKGASPITLHLQMKGAGNDRITGTVEGGTWTADLRADRAVFKARVNPAPYSGKYTLIIPGSGDPADASVPQGDGYAAVAVNRAGLLRLRGALADGTVLVQNSRVALEGEFPIYRSLYRGGGQVLGWISFDTASSESELSGWLSFIKPALATARSYPGGFELLDTNVAGSPYNPFALPVTGFTQGNVTLTGGGLATNLTASVSVSLNGRVTAAPGGSSWRLRLNKAQGLFAGKVTVAGAKRPIQFKGALFQDKGIGSGYFLDGNQSGKVTFGP